MIEKRFTILLLILLAANLSWGAAGSVEGKITDATTGEPLVGANVFLEGTSTWRSY